MRGSGRIYQRGETYFVAYSIGGREFRESSRSTHWADAQALLERRLTERDVAVQQAAEAAPYSFQAMAAAYLDEYAVREFRTGSTARLRVTHLTAFFGGMAAAAITSGLVRQYQAMRRTQRAAAATVNRETAALHRMCKLAERSGALTRVVVFPERLRENPPRQGFFEHVHYVAVRALLPAAFQDVLDFAYYSGWRKQEILELTWDEVDWDGRVIRLDPRRSKTLSGRVLPLAAPLRTVLERRRGRRVGNEPHVFGRDGMPIRRWRTCFRDACRRANVPAALLHDCRRTAARNLVRAGVPERVAMTLLGHKTRSMFDRYNIVSERDLLNASTQLATYIDQQAART
jgi:integrase